MGEKDDLSELLKRKYEPISDWKPASASSGPLAGIKGFVSDTLEDVGKAKQAVEEALEPFSEDAVKKIKEVLGTVEEAAGSTSKEARSALAGALESLAEKIKP
jgi:uncharacterized protein YjbJ (UPF0337 family)